MEVSNPDADHIGGFLDVFDAFPVETVYVSGDPNNTLTYNTFLRGVRDEGARIEVLRAGALMDYCCYGACLARWFVGEPAVAAQGLTANLTYTFGVTQRSATTTTEDPAPTYWSSSCKTVGVREL